MWAGPGAEAQNERQSVPPGVGPPPQTPPVAGVWGLSGMTFIATWALVARIVDREGTPQDSPVSWGTRGVAQFLLCLPASSKWYAARQRAVEAAIVAEPAGQSGRIPAGQTAYDPLQLPPVAEGDGSAV